MGRKCVIKTCTNSTNKPLWQRKNIMFHMFPCDKVRRDSWLQNIQVLANQTEPFREKHLICSDHFEKSAYEKRNYGRKALKPSARPTIFNVKRDICFDVQYSASELGIAESSRNGDAVGVKCVEEIVIPDVDRSGNISGSVDLSKVKCEVECEEEIVIPDIDRSGNISGSVDLSKVKCEVECDEEIVIPDIETTDYDLTKVKCEKELTIYDVNEEVYESSCPEIKNTNTYVSKSEIVPSPVYVHLQSKIHNSLYSLQQAKAIRYPGDISDISNMSTEDVEKCVLICKEKIKIQAETIKDLKRKVKRKDKQLEVLRSLVKRLKNNEVSASSVKSIVDEL